MLISARPLADRIAVGQLDGAWIVEAAHAAEMMIEGAVLAEIPLSGHDNRCVPARGPLPLASKRDGGGGVKRISEKKNLEIQQFNTTGKINSPDKTR